MKKVVFLYTVLLILPNVGNAADPNLVSHWRLDEGCGPVAHDSVNNWDGTIYGGASWTSNGKFGGALVFDGYNDYVNIGNLGITGDWTVTFWAKSSNNTGTIYYPIGLSYPYAGIIMGGVYPTVSQHISIFDGTAVLRAITTVETSIWYHVAVTKNGANYSIYVNGKHEKTGELMDIDLTGFKMGVRAGLFGYFEGTIDDVGVWNHAAELGDIEDPEPGTINYARINGVSGPGYGVSWNPRPVNEQTGAPNDITLMWRPGECATEVDEHRVYFSTDFDSVNQGTVPCVCVTEPNYAPGILDLSTTYYWRVDEIIDSNVWKGPVWSFTTRPGWASESYPSNNAQQVSSDIEISWIPGGYVADTNGHDVYFGTEFNDVKKGRRILVSDMDGDEQVNFADLWLFSEQWLGYVEGLEPQADLNGDKAVNLIDFAIMADEWKASIVHKGRQTANRYDPCNLEFGTTYFWRVDEYNEPNVWPGEVWSFTVGIDEPTLTNAPTYQITPTYDGSGQVVHPDIVYFPDGWNGYKYWMAMTPYPYSNNQKENPSILVSNDGYSWQVPPGLINPIIYPPNPGNNGDTDIVYNDDANELWVYFVRYWSAAKLVKLTLMRSSNGINWSEPEYLLTWDVNLADNERSYAIIKQGSEWHYWAETRWSAPYDVCYRHSTDGRNWSEAQNIVFSPVPEILPWHLDVIYVPAKSEYWMLFNCPANKGGSLFLAKSRDRLNWTPALNKVLSPSVYGWDNYELYRATLLYDSTSQLLRVWYSAINNLSEWHTGYTATEY